MTSNPEFIIFMCGLIIGLLVGVAIVSIMAYGKLQDLYCSIAKYEAEMRQLRRSKT